MDTVIKDGRLIEFQTSTDKRGGRAFEGVIRQAGRSANIIDVWYWGLCALPIDDLPLSELLSLPLDRKQLRRDSWEGRTVYQIDVEKAGRRLEMWVDPAVNYLIRKTVSALSEKIYENAI